VCVCVCGNQKIGIGDQMGGVHTFSIGRSFLALMCMADVWIYWPVHYHLDLRFNVQNLVEG
jgi:hypothetical protein